MLYLCRIQTPVGVFQAAEEDGKLVSLDLDKNMPPQGEERVTPLLMRLEEELRQYFARARTCFDIPLAPSGTPFQMRCYDGLLSIPYGETRSYSWLAGFAQSPRGARAAGGACHSNPILILIPCHRVIGASGKLTGFGGGIEVKEALLALEHEGR